MVRPYLETDQASTEGRLDRGRKCPAFLSTSDQQTSVGGELIIDVTFFSPASAGNFRPADERPNVLYADLRTDKDTKKSGLGGKFVGRFHKSVTSRMKCEASLTDVSGLGRGLEAWAATDDLFTWVAKRTD